MVKAGVFLLARMYPVLAGTDLWFVIVTTVGAITFVYGAYIALLKHDLKGLLAYSTVSHLGLITLLFGLDTPLAAVAAVFHIINHAIFKASLFMSAGIIDHETGTRDMRRMGGLFKTMPRTSVLGHSGGGIDGGRAAAERLPVEGNVLYGGRGARGISRSGLHPTGGRNDRRYAWRCLFGTLRVGRVLRRCRRSLCQRRRTSRRCGCACRWKCSLVWC